MPGVLAAGAWGLLAGAALVVGALVGFLVRVPGKVLASVMAFGAGVFVVGGLVRADRGGTRAGRPRADRARRRDRRRPLHRGQRAARPSGRTAPEAVRRPA